MDRSNIEKISETQDDAVLLAQIWDKLCAGMRKNIPSNTCFLSARELEMARYLFGKQDGLHEFGGYADAQRKMLIYLPDYCNESMLLGEGSPIVCLRATFYENDSPAHCDFLGALIGSGIAREAIGDICVGSGSCDFFVTAQIAPYLLQSFTCAGRVKLRLAQVPLGDVRVPEPKFDERKDTVASVRLDSVVASGFRISRGKALQLIEAGRAAVNGLPCEKADKLLAEGMTISVRGLGKIRLTAIGSQTKKGRICVTIQKYV